MALLTKFENMYEARIQDKEARIQDMEAWIIHWKTQSFKSEGRLLPK